MPPGMSPEFRARQFDVYQPPAQITGAVEAPIEAQARETPAPVSRNARNRRSAYFVSAMFPVCFAVMAIVFGDMRLAMILVLMSAFMALVGLFTLAGPA